MPSVRIGPNHGFSIEVLVDLLLPDLLGPAEVDLAAKIRFRFPFNSVLTGVY